MLANGRTTFEYRYHTLVLIARYIHSIGIPEKIPVKAIKFRAFKTRF